MYYTKVIFIVSGGVCSQRIYTRHQHPLMYNEPSLTIISKIIFLFHQTGK